MFKKVWDGINPLAHLGEKKYSIFIPFFITVFLYILSELFAYFILKQPSTTGNLNIILTFLLVIYFSFRFGLKGGLTTVFASILFFTYFIYSRQESIQTKEFATTLAIILTGVYAVLAGVLGWLRQKIDNLFYIEMQSKVAAEEAEEKFKTLANNIPNLVWMAKPDGYIFWYNSRWFAYTGTTQKQMEGWGWEAVHDPKILPEVVKKWKTSIKTGKPFEMIFPLKGADGKFRPFLTRIVPVKNKLGKITYWFGTNTDVSEQEELNRRKDSFIAMASHELKTPLTSLTVYSHMLLKEFKNNQTATTYIKKLNAQVDSLKVLVSDLLDTSRIQEEKLQMQKKEFILKNEALEIISDIQTITDHKLIVDWKTQEKVYADKYRLRQVLTNLLTNAIKFSSGKSNIIITARINEQTIVVSIQDFGIGISKKSQQHIFDRFYQVDDVTAKTYPGLGLGLFISYEIIKQMNGKMWVQSEKGKGSTFSFSLPIYKKH